MITGVVIFTLTYFGALFVFSQICVIHERRTEEEQRQVDEWLQKHG